MTDTAVSIAIATLNRREDLRATLLELQKLVPAPLEIIVCLDGCTDGSREMLCNFPFVTVIENASPSGSVFSRDRLFRMARGDLIVSLDDDSFPTQPDFVKRLCELATKYPEAGVFAFQEIRPESRDDRPFKSPHAQGFVASYANCAGAIRSRLYGDLASYPVFFFHMYEEPDFCLQTYAKGLGVFYDPSITVLHRYSHVGRNMIGRHHQHARNELLSVLLRCPLPHVFWVASYRILRQFVFALANGPAWAIREPIWWWQALKSSKQALRERRPVPWDTYWGWVRLARRPIPSSEKLAARFPTDQIATVGDRDR